MMAECFVSTQTQDVTSPDLFFFYFRDQMRTKSYHMPCYVPAGKVVKRKKDVDCIIGKILASLYSTQINTHISYASDLCYCQLFSSFNLVSNSNFPIAICSSYPGLWNYANTIAIVAVLPTCARKCQQVRLNNSVDLIYLLLIPTFLRIPNSY